MKKIERADTYYATSLLKSDKQVYRVYVDGGRMYYTLDENNRPTFYLSLTTMLSRLIPKTPHLIDWMIGLGKDNAKKYMDLRAEYGTLMHYAFGVFLTNREWDFDGTERFIDDCIAQGVIRGQYREVDWEDQINKDVAAFAQWVYDYKVETLAIEIVLVSEHGYGTAIDLVCKLVSEEKALDYDNPYKSGPRKGQPREVKIKKEQTALINFKSGRKGFYEEHEVQLEFERMVFEENFPEVKVDAIYNWSPKDWVTTPSYNFKDQSESLNREKAQAYLTIAKMDLMGRLSSYVAPTGKLSYGSTASMKRVTIEDEVADRTAALTAEFKDDHQNVF